MINKVRRSFLAIAVICASVCAALFLCEICVRLFLPQNTYSGGFDYLDEQLFDLKPDYCGEFACADYRYTCATDHNRMRLTKTYFDPGKRKSILVIGDSFAFGMGVDDTETLASVIADSLHKWKIPTLISNASVPGYSAAEEAEKYHQVKYLVRPDAVVIVSCFNDFATTLPGCDTIELEGPQNQIESKLQLWTAVYPTIKKNLLGHSQLAVLLAIRCNQVLITLGIRDAFRGVMAAYEPFTYIQNKQSVDNVEIVYKKLFEETRKDSIPTIFVYVPGLLEIDDQLWQTAKQKTPSLDRKLAHNRIVHAARQAGFTNVVDPIAAENGKRLMQGLYFPLDMHLNKKGQAYFGALIAQKLRDILALPSFL